MDIIKGYFGYIYLILFYYFFGAILGSSFFEGDYLLYLIEYCVLAIIALPNCIMSVKPGQNKRYFGWLIISSIPGGCYMLYARFDNSPGGFIKFPWDWLMWAYTIPIIFVLAQLIFLSYVMGINQREKMQ
jgi:hypothetical protein